MIGKLKNKLTVVLISLAMKTTEWGDTWDELYTARLSEVNKGKWAYK